MNIKKRLSSLSKLFGLDLGMSLESFLALPLFLKQLKQFRKSYSKHAGGWAWGKLYPCLNDFENDENVAKGHYFHQDIIIARRILERNPKRHADIGSRIDGFVSHVAVFREIEVFDIRPLETDEKNIIFRQADFMKPINREFIGKFDSVSCLHVLEHFGLGRYGDSIDYNGHRNGLSNLASLLEKDGILYLSVPMGKRRIEFNAHRVFSISYLVNMCEEYFRVLRFSYVDDMGSLFENVSTTSDEAKNNYNCVYGCAILELQKRQ